MNWGEFIRNDAGRGQTVTLLRWDSETAVEGIWTVDPQYEYQTVALFRRDALEFISKATNHEKVYIQMWGISGDKYSAQFHIVGLDRVMASNKDVCGILSP